jgi:hypothetical protein
MHDIKNIKFKHMFTKTFRFQFHLSLLKCVCVCVCVLFQIETKKNIWFTKKTDRDEDRTHDLLVNSQSLCQLSYTILYKYITFK